MKNRVFVVCGLSVISVMANGMDCAEAAEDATAAPIQALPAFTRTSWKFDFGAKKNTADSLAVTPGALYNPAQGFGFEPRAAVVTANESGCTANQPFFFSAAVPEGNYRVTVTVGDKNAATNTTVKAEGRRLALENISTAPGMLTTQSFLVNIRSPRIAGGGSVSLNGREMGPPVAPQWDDKLTLEFNGSKPCVDAVEISPVTDAVTIFLAGDSTVTDQGNEPYAGWGQMLPRFFRPTVAVANHAESGLTLGSFRGQKRLAKVLSLVKAGDYVFVQFGHNDQKDKGANAGPFTSYKTNLKDYVTQIRAHGATPILVTPMERRRWTEGKASPTLADYAEAVRQTGQQETVPVIDLNAMSLKFYGALGEEPSKKAFAYLAMGSFPGQTVALKDNTHFNNYGGYELARCIVQGIRDQVPALAAQLAEGIAHFDPAEPDALDKFDVPLSPFKVSEKPAGS